MMTSMKKAALCAALATAWATDAVAHHPGGPGNPNASGPINTISASTLPKGAAAAGLVAEATSLDALSDDALAEAAEAAHETGEHHAHVHSLDAIRSAALTFAYGVTDDLTLSVRLPHVTREDVREGHTHENASGEAHGSVHALGDSSGFGDLAVLAQWRFLQMRDLEMAALIGLEAPTGETEEKNGEGEAFDAEFQPGSESWDFLIGLAVTRRLGRWSFDASGLYTMATAGVADTDLGDRFNYGLAASYRAFGSRPHAHPEGMREHSHGPALDLVLELNGEWHAEQQESGEADVNSGGHVLYLAPGARVSLDALSAFASLGVPIARDLTGVQAEPDLRVVGGIAYRF
jgi:hypothetical protein